MSSSVVYRSSRASLFDAEGGGASRLDSPGGPPPPPPPPPLAGRPAARDALLVAGLVLAALTLVAHVSGAPELLWESGPPAPGPARPLGLVVDDPDQLARQPFQPPRAFAARSSADPRWFEPDYGWRNRTGSDLTTCVVVRTYVNQRNMLMALLGSLAASRHPGLFTILVDTGKAEPFDELPALAALFNELSERPHAVSVSRWAYHNSRALYPQLAVEDFGYVATDLALEDALYGSWPLGADGLPVLHCDTFVVTNGDNMYTAAFFEEALRAAATERYDMIGTHWVSHYNWNSPVWDTRSPEQLRANKHCGSLRSGLDMEMWAAHDFHVACIDLGAVLWRRWLIETTGNRFVLDALAVNGTGQHFDFFTADGWFFQRAHRLPTARTHIIRESLMIHQ